jgi:hypothetical protein
MEIHKRLCAWLQKGDLVHHGNRSRRDRLTCYGRLLGPSVIDVSLGIPLAWLFSAAQGAAHRR